MDVNQFNNSDMPIRKISSAIFYGLTSFLITVINKTVLSSYKFPSLLTLFLGQLSATILVLSAGSQMNVWSIPNIGVKKIIHILPISLVALANAIFGLGGTRAISLPMFAALRRVSIIMTMLLEWQVLGIQPSLTIQFSVYAMVAGTILASMGDLSFNTMGYLYIMVANVLTAANGVYIKKILYTNDIDKYGLIFYNSIFMFIPTLAMAWITGDLHSAIQFEHWNDTVFVAQFVFSCFMGFILSYSTILSTQYNSALTTATVGSIKSTAVTYLGVFIGGDFIFSWLNWTGINISVSGSLMYSYFSFLNSNKLLN